MAIQRWDPLRDLLQLQERMNRLFEESYVRSGQALDVEALASVGWRPALDVFELADRYVLRADVAGVAATDVEIEVEDGRLVLRGERRQDAGVPKEAFLRVERPMGRFSVQVALPPSVDEQGIRAVQRDGVLEVSLPKRGEKPSSRLKVEVK